MLRWKIDLPLLTLNCFNSFKMLVLFEFIPTDIVSDWIKKKLGIHSSGIQAKSIDENNKQELDVLKDGTILFAGVLILLVIVVLLILNRCNALVYKDYRIFKIYMTIRRKIFHNSIIRYFYTGAIKLQVTACDIFVAGFVLTFSTCTQWFVAITIFVALYGIYFKFFFYMRSNRDDLPKLSMRDKIGTLYESFEIFDS